MFAESFRAPVPPALDSLGEITFYIGASKIMTMEEAQAYAQEMQQAAGEKQMEKDIEIIDAYLADNNITAQSTESGLRYVIEAEGTGSNPEQGQKVKVHYTGTLLDGTEFDSSAGKDPIQFPIGQGGVIQGWDEGIALLKKGGKATLYIPSQLAYGPRARSEVIQANSILKFEVELVDIE